MCVQNCFGIVIVIAVSIGFVRNGGKIYNNSEYTAMSA